MTEQPPPDQLPQSDTVLPIVKPHLETAATFLAQDAGTFLKHLQAFLADPEDVTGLRLLNLLSEVQGLEAQITLMSDLLGQIDANRRKVEQ